MEKYESLIEIMRQKNENLEKAYDDLQREKGRLVSENNQLRHSVASRDRIILELETEISLPQVVDQSFLVKDSAERQRQYEFEARIEKLEAHLRCHQETTALAMENKNRQIEQLEREIMKKTAEMAALAEHTNDQAERIIRLEAEATQCTARLTENETELANGRECVELLLAEIGHLETHIVSLQNSFDAARQGPQQTPGSSFCSPALLISSKSRRVPRRRTSSPTSLIGSSSVTSSLDETSLYSELLNELAPAQLDLDGNDDSDTEELSTPQSKKSRLPTIKGRLELFAPPTPGVSREYEIVSSPASKPVKKQPTKPSVVTCLKRLVRRVSGAPKPKNPLRRCESSVDVIRSYPTQFRF